MTLPHFWPPVPRPTDGGAPIATLDQAIQIRGSREGTITSMRQISPTNAAAYARGLGRVSRAKC